MRDMEPVFKSLGHEKRLRILDWLRDPEETLPALEGRRFGRGRRLCPIDHREA